MTDNPAPRGRGRVGRALRDDGVRRAGSVAAVALAAAVGVAVGAVVMAAVQDAGSAPAPVRPAADDSTHAGTATGGHSNPAPDAADALDPDDTRTAAGPETARRPPGPAVLLAWTPTGLDPGLVAAAVADPDVVATTVVRGGVLDLVGSRDATGAAVDTVEPGWAIPLDAVAVHPARHAAFVPVADRAAVAGLSRGQALLGATSATLRRLGPGSVVDLAGGGSVTVAGVVSDPAVGGAELAVDTATGAALGLTTDRYLLASYDGDRSALEHRLRAGLRADSAVRFRGPGETPVLRHGDAVLPQARIKERFGEFAYRPGAGDEFAQDQAWQEASLVTVDLPIIGTARCHRAAVEALTGALDEVVANNLSGLVDPDGFAGCWNPRTTRAGTSLSRHAWGVAIDLNFGANPTGLASVQDPRLVAIFRRWGFTEGSRWLVPDAGHFEYVSPPRG